MIRSRRFWRSAAICVVISVPITMIVFALKLGPLGALLGIPIGMLIGLIANINLWRTLGPF